MADTVTVQEIINSIEHIEKLLEGLRMALQGLENTEQAMPVSSIQSTQSFGHDGYIGKACNK
jgi:hypothetical protein